MNPSPEFQALIDAWWSRYREHRQADKAQRDTEQAAFDAFHASEQRIIRTPAKNIADLRAKAEIIWGDPNALPQAPQIAAFFSDLRRMTDNAPSVTFDVEAWFAWFEHMGGGWVEREGEIILMAPVSEAIQDCYHDLELHGGRDLVADYLRQKVPA